MKKLLTAGVIILLSTVPVGPATGGMRCGTDLISEQSNKFEVLASCGEPLEKFGEGLTIGDEEIIDGGEEHWIYDFGSGVYYVVTFDGFEVRKIESKQK
ncbi:MAG: DUF2845 domain-containing protein [Syntrophotaleaceae bacterium]